MNRKLWVIFFAVSFHFAFQGKILGQTEKSADPGLKKALELLQHHEGIWDCRWEFIDDEGKVTRTLEGTETNRFIIEDRILEVTTEIPAIKRMSKSWRFYHPIEKKLYFTSVDKSGDLWILTEEVDSDLLVSHPHKLADGRELTIRFKVTERRKNGNWLLVMRDDSFDGGTTWTPRFRQTLNKRTVNN